MTQMTDADIPEAFRKAFELYSELVLVPKVKKMIEEAQAQLNTTPMLLTVAQVAHMLGVSERKVFYLKAEGQLNAVNVDSATRFTREEVHAYVRRLADGNRRVRPARGRRA